MIYGYHIIMPHYGFWLPNDPRGSWSNFVGKWELALEQRSTRSFEQKNLGHLETDELESLRDKREKLDRAPVQLSGHQALSVAMGFSDQVSKSHYKIWACTILPSHTHLVAGRHKYPVEQMAILLKGSATRKLVQDQNHPFLNLCQKNGRPPTIWAKKIWKTYLDNHSAIDNAINYVIENPIKENKPRQSWSWVEPFSGIDSAWIHVD